MAQEDRDCVEEVTPDGGSSGGQTTTSPLKSFPQPPEAAAYQGLAGAIVQTIFPHTEADKVALLLQLLVAFGNAVGRGAYCVADGARHHPVLFAVLVGDTSRARKGSSWKQIVRLMEVADSVWSNRCISGGLSSGEGLIYRLRDGNRDDDGSEKVVATDKRLLFAEGEFARVLKTLTREGNVLSDILRQAWDGDRLSVVTKTSPCVATGTHVSVNGHITREELLRHMSTTEAANGFGNRFLWACVQRSKRLPEGGALQHSALEPVAERVSRALSFARSAGEIRRNEEARSMWAVEYERLTDGHPGLLGAMTARAEAQVLRLSLLYALLDRSAVVRAEHLRAAVAIWDYCDASARYIFGGKLGDPLAETLYTIVRANVAGLTRTELSKRLNHNVSASEMTRALNGLVERRMVYRTEERHDEGRPSERWHATENAGKGNPADERNERNEESSSAA